MIDIQEYKKFPDRTFGLGQDVSQNLSDVVKVAALFVSDSDIHKKLINGGLKKVTLDEGAPEELYNELLSSLDKQMLSHKQLVSLKSKYGRSSFASGLIRAIFPGQRSAVIGDWPATNYLSVAVGMGLIDLDYSKDLYFITDLGKEAVELLDSNSEKINSFMLNRLYEYPYAAWLIRLVNTDKSKKFTKFDMGDNFGFIDEPGFISLPEDLFVDGLLDAKADNNKKLAKTIKSNFESTADKYMRWLAGTLVNYGLLKKDVKVTKKIINNKSISIKQKAYKVTMKGLSSLNIVNGGSSHKRTVKRVRWEYLAPRAENALKRKTARALMLKFMSESANGISSEKLSEKINKIQPSLKVIPEQIIDDAKGLNRIGIEIEIKENKLILKDKLYDFVIPVKKNFTFKHTEADNVKTKILPKVKHINHRYLQAIDIAFKNKTTNQENTQLEILSTELFIKEAGFSGSHMGGSNKPDGFAFDDNTGWIIDSKAYHEGFPVRAHNTDPMGRYINQYRERNDRSMWWKSIPEDLKNTHFVYVSSYFIGNYEDQIKDFEIRNNMTGGLVEIAKLILLADKVKGDEISIKQFNSYILDKNISMDSYFPLLT